MKNFDRYEILSSFTLGANSQQRLLFLGEIINISVIQMNECNKLAPLACASLETTLSTLVFIGIITKGVLCLRDASRRHGDDTTRTSHPKTLSPKSFQLNPKNLPT